MVDMKREYLLHLYDVLGDAWCSLEHAKSVYGSMKLDNKTKELFEMQEKLISLRRDISTEVKRFED